MFSSFGWFVFHVFVTVFWLVVAVTTGQWYWALGSGAYIVVLVFLDLPGSSSDGDGGDEDNGGP